MASVSRHLLLPTRTSGAKASRRIHRTRFLFGIAPGGACHAGPVARPAVGSYPTVSPLPSSLGGLFSVTLSLGLPRPGVTRRRCFVESGLSSNDGSKRHQRPSSHPCGREIKFSPKYRQPGSGAPNLALPPGHSRKSGLPCGDETAVETPLAGFRNQRQDTRIPTPRCGIPLRETKLQPVLPAERKLRAIPLLARPTDAIARAFSSQISGLDPSSAWEPCQNAR